MHAHGHRHSDRHADMDTCSHVGYVQTYVQHRLPIWWASMSHFSINACNFFPKGCPNQNKLEGWHTMTYPKHTHFPFTWLRNDVFQKKKKRNAQAARENMEHCGQVCLLCCYGASVANGFMYCSALFLQGGQGFYWKKRWELEVSIDISELAISRNLGGMVEHRLLSAIFQVQMLSAMSNGYVHSTCICSNRCCFRGSGCLAVWALRGWSHAVLLWSVARAWPIEWQGMIRFFPGMFGNLISSEFACVCHVEVH